jgi:dimethylargininase
MQHAEYERALVQAGYSLVQLPELPDAPDSVFVEDVAIVLGEVAILTRPGAESRREEVSAMAETLRRFRPVSHITEPGTLDGGDVLVLDRQIFVGLSTRTNGAGVSQLRALCEPHNYSVSGLRVSGALHLKTAVTRVAPGTLLINPRWIDPAAFGDFEVIEVDPQEPFAANAVLTPAGVIHSTEFPHTQARLVAAGVRVNGVDASELAKAEGGVTCCSLLVA